MTQYEFPADESLDDHVPADEEVESVTYRGDTEIVETSTVDLEEADRNELRAIAKEYDNVDGNASEEELREALKEEME